MLSDVAAAADPVGSGAGESVPFSKAKPKPRRRWYEHVLIGIGGAANLATVATIGLMAATRAGYGVDPPPAPSIAAELSVAVERPAAAPAAPATSIVPEPKAEPKASAEALVPVPPPKPEPSVAADAPGAPSQPKTEPGDRAAAPAEPPPVAQTPRPSGEAEIVARLDALIGPVRDLTPSVDDALRVRDAFAAGSNVAQAKLLRDQITDPIARKLVDWQLLRNGVGTWREIRAFVDANPLWPNQDLLHQRAEEQLFMAGGTVRDIKAYFAGNAPKSAIGEAALASAYLAESNEAEATRLASKVWRTGAIPATLETGFIERFGKVLTEVDHKARLDRYLVDDSRWDAERRDRAAVARRIVPFLTDPEKAKANARIAVYLKTADAQKLLAALPADAATRPTADWGFAYQLAQWHRRGNRVGETWDILRNAPTSGDDAINLDDWWTERRAAAYEALKAGQPETAYDLVKSPGALGVNAQKDATFLAGWIALRHLNRPAEAEQHFAALEKAADGPLSRGKAAYWLARTHEAAGAKDKVRDALERAARNTDTFYGLLARQLLKPDDTRVDIPDPALPSAAEAEAFNARDAVRATVIARKAGLDFAVTRAFLTHLRNSLTSEPEQALLAHLAEAIGDTQMAVRIAKQAIARGLNLLSYGYPIHAMPAYQPLRPAPELALLLAIARQESEFNVQTRSGAGARGLLQVMPITAQHVCKDYRLKCEIDRLSTEPSYNVMVASAYIGDRMDEFNGSYVLTLAGYNAGPGRARQWMREFGDPRDPKVDPIDWIHRIPFEETREYVLKVLSNLQIYRARLGEGATALRLEQDLRRTGNLRRQASSGG